MEHEHVLAALIRKRAHLAGEADMLRTRVAQINADLAHLDAAIQLFDAELDPGTIRPVCRRGPDAARHGERSRAMLTVMREAGEPLTAAEIARRVMVQQGLEVGDQRFAQRLKKQLLAALTRQQQRGVVRSEQRPGQVVLWAPN